MISMRGLTTALMAVSTAASLESAPVLAQTPATFTVYAQGLEAPRGLRFGPDGYLYVAEAGTGGTRSTGSACTQVVAPVGPYTGGPSARISKIGADGT